MICEDLDAFLADFGVDCTIGSVTRQAILDMPDDPLLGDRVQSTAYNMTYETEDFPDLRYGTRVSIADTWYEVLTVQKVDDGKFSRAQLQKS